MPGITATAVPGIGVPTEFGQRFVGNQELDAQRRTAEAAQNERPILELSAYIQRRWERARQARENNVSPELLSDLRQRSGEYDEATLRELNEIGAPDVFMRITSTKCDAALAWLNDIIMAHSDSLWAMRPTSEPSVSPVIEQQIVQQTVQQVHQQLLQSAAVTGQRPDPQMLQEYAFALAMQNREQIERGIGLEARKRAEAMEKKIKDQFQEGEWGQALEDAAEDVVTFKNCFIKGPVVRKVRCLQWDTSANGFTIAKAREVLRPTFTRVSPLDFYPGPSNRGLNDGYTVERLSLSADRLQSLLDSPGYSNEAIGLVLGEYQTGGHKIYTTIDQERADLEQRPDSLVYRDDLIEGLEYAGTAPGFMLKEWGIQGIKDHNRPYFIKAIKVGRHVIYAKVTANPLGENYYSSASFENRPGSFWGNGIPYKMRDIQKVANAVIRALMVNMAHAAGPQVGIDDLERLAPGEDPKSVFPWRVWLFKNPDRSSNKPIDFYQPNPLIGQLLEAYEYFQRLADEHTGVPAYTAGIDKVSSAGSTASGLSMLMGAASRGIKKVVSNLDQRLFGPTIMRQYVFNMLYLEDESIKGDLQVETRGIVGQIVREQVQSRRADFLAATNNPVDLELTGMDGRAKVMRKVSEDLDMPLEDVVRSDEVLMQREQMMAQQQQEQQQLEEQSGKESSVPG